jgi:hypothetical protein
MDTQQSISAPRAGGAVSTVAARVAGRTMRTRFTALTYQIEPRCLLRAKSHFPSGR